MNSFHVKDRIKANRWMLPGWKLQGKPPNRKRLIQTEAVLVTGGEGGFWDKDPARMRPLTRPKHEWRNKLLLFCSRSRNVVSMMPLLGNILGLQKRCREKGPEWLSRLIIWCLISAQVLISIVSSSPALGSMLDVEPTLKEKVCFWGSKWGRGQRVGLASRPHAQHRALCTPWDQDLSWYKELDV